MRLVLNSICKINSPGQERWEDSYKFVPSFLPPFLDVSSSFSHLLVAQFQARPSSQTFFLLPRSPRSTLRLSALLRAFIWEVLVDWVVTLWGCTWWLVVQLGVAVVWVTGSVWEGHRSGVMGAVGTVLGECVCERSLCYWASFCPDFLSVTSLSLYSFLLTLAKPLALQSDAIAFKLVTSYWYLIFERSTMFLEPKEALYQV